MSYLNDDEIDNLEETFTDPSPKLIFADWAQLSIEELMELKMEKGHRKYGDPANYTWPEMAQRFHRHIGEWFVASEGFDDHIGMLEAIADICNVGKLLFPKLQELYIEARQEWRDDAEGREPVALEPRWGKDATGAEEARRLE